MNNNGYQIIDLKGRVLDTGDTVDGLYAKIEALEKMPLFVNVKIKNDDTVIECLPFTSYCTAYGTSFVIKCGEVTDGSASQTNMYITVSDEDEITISVMSV